MITTTWKKLICAVIPMLGALGPLSAGCGTTEPTEHDDEHVGVVDEALTAQQCNYFAVDGKVQICHRTGSAKNPYSITKVATQACINAHAMHAGDYVAVNDPTCQGVGCLPQGAPCDPTVPCCDGFSCTNGTCKPNVSNHCNPSPCQNGGSCTNDPIGYTCSCPAGYTGTNCENEIDECESSPCVHGQCLDAINAYECACEPGYTGDHCEIDIDECMSNPCVNGDCTDLVNGYECGCLPGYTGDHCEIGIDECASNPCVNGNCIDQDNDYTCACQPGFTGKNCEDIENNIDECESNPCVMGECIDQVNDYACACYPGFEGKNCDQEVATGYDCAANNPCTPENAAIGQFYFPSSSSASSFIQCSAYGQCYVMSCYSGTTWNQDALNCL